MWAQHSSKAPRRRKMKKPLQNLKYVQPLVLESEMPGSVIELRDKIVGNLCNIFSWLSMPFSFLNAFFVYSHFIRDLIIAKDGCSPNSILNSSEYTLFLFVFLLMCNQLGVTLNFMSRPRLCFRSSGQ